MLVHVTECVHAVQETQGLHSRVAPNRDIGGFYDNK